MPSSSNPFPKIRSFSMEVQFLLAMVVGANGMYALFYPPPMSLLSTFLMVSASLLLFLLLVYNPPILPIFFQTMTMSMLHIFASKGTPPQAGWKEIAPPIIAINITAVSTCYFLYMIGRFSLGSRSTTPQQQCLVLPVLRTGLHVAVEMALLFVSNTFFMISAFRLTSAETTSKSMGGAMMLFSCILYLLQTLGGLQAKVKMILAENVEESTGALVEAAGEEMV